MDENVEKLLLVGVFVDVGMRIDDAKHVASALNEKGEEWLVDVANNNNGLERFMQEMNEKLHGKILQRTAFDGVKKWAEIRRITASSNIAVNNNTNYVYGKKSR